MSPTGVADDGGGGQRAETGGPAEDPPTGIRTAISVYGRGRGPAEYPQVLSGSADGQPISWGALSGLAADPDDADTLYAVSDSAYAEGAIYRVDVSTSRAVITERVAVDGADDLDLEGITIAPDGTRWLASEGNATDERANRLLQVDAAGDVYLVGRLPLSVVTADEIDRILGSVLQYADESFDPLLEIGFASSIRREWAWRQKRGESTANLKAFARFADPDR